MELNPIVAQRLRRVAGKIRSGVTLNGLACLCGYLFVAAVVVGAVDDLANGLRWSMRAALVFATLLGAIGVLWKLIVEPLRCSFGSAEVAHLLERRHPELRTLLVSAVRFQDGQVGSPEVCSPILVASVMEQAGRMALTLDFEGVLNIRIKRMAMFSIATLLLVFSFLFWAFPKRAELWLNRSVLLREVPWPKETTLVVEAQGDAVIGARGDDLTIQAHALGVQPREVDIVFTTASGRRGRQSMVTVGGGDALRYRHTFERAQEEFTFYLEGGDDRTETYRACLLDRPQVVRSEVRIQPPTYTQMETSVLGDGQRAAQVLRGSNVTIRIGTNHPVKKALLVHGDQPVVEATSEGDRYSATFTPNETHTYHFDLLDDAGLENREVTRFSLQVVKDEAPRVRLRVPGAGDMITPEAVLPFEMQFEDVYGLAVAELRYQVSREGSEERAIKPPTFAAGMRNFTANFSWPVATEDVKPGERITLVVQAADFDDVSGPNVARSPEVNLRVVTRDELLSELARREEQYRAEYERLIDAQEQVRGRLLSLQQKFTDEGFSAALSEQIASVERTQRNVASSVNVIRQQFEQILRELQISQLNSIAIETRIGGGIVEPLSLLVKRDFGEAADEIRRWSGVAGSPSPELDQRQVTLLAQMRTILSNMIHRAGFQEVVNMLRDIIRLQEELHKESKQTAEGADWFDDVPPKQK
ncbi:MAG: hypothetical protein AABZ47_04600 [Planctomycetota bacterium]